MLFSLYSLRSWIQNGLIADPDPIYYTDADPDSTLWTDEDPNFTYLVNIFLNQIFSV